MIFAVVLSQHIPEKLALTQSGNFGRLPQPIVLYQQSVRNIREDIMRCFWVLALMVATTGFMAGCNNCDSCSAPDKKGDQESQEKQKEDQKQGDQASQATPEAVVHTFLEALKQKNVTQAYQCLSPIARRELLREQLYIVESLVETVVQYDIGETLRPEDNTKAAGVKSKLTQQFGPGTTPQKIDIGWALYVTDEGWRIKGMIPSDPNGNSYFFDLENPKEIREKRAAMAAQRQQQPSNVQKNKTILR